MEDAHKFEEWLDQTIKDAQEKLQITDAALAYILLRRGLHYYLRTIAKTALD